MPKLNTIVPRLLLTYISLQNCLKCDMSHLVLMMNLKENPMINWPVTLLLSKEPWNIILCRGFVLKYLWGHGGFGDIWDLVSEINVNRFPTTHRHPQHLILIHASHKLTCIKLQAFKIWFGTKLKVNRDILSLEARELSFFLDKCMFISNQNYILHTF